MSELFSDPFFRKPGKKGTFRVLPREDVPQVGSITDSHCHLQMCENPAYEAARMELWGVGRICNVVDLSEEPVETFDKLEAWLHEGHEQALQWADLVGVEPDMLRRPELSLIVGCHPENASAWNDEVAARIEAVAKDPRVCAIGEAGLEYYYLCSPKEVQEQAFREAIRLAKRVELPLCLHVRDAHEEAYAILEEEGFPEAGCVLHCFTATAEVLEPWLKRGVYVGFDGPVTFLNNDDLREALRKVPEDRLLVETDAPFMAPVPLRGMPCGPGHVIFTAASMANSLGYTPQDLPAFCERLNENASRLYNRRVQV